MLLLALVCVAPPTGWVGVAVMAKSDEAVVTRADGNGGFEPGGNLDPDSTYSVREEKGDKLRIRFEGKDAWVLKADVVRGTDAVRHFTKEIAADPTDADARGRRGIARVQWPNPDRTAALADFDKAIELDADSAQWRLRRGFLRTDLRQYEKAVEDFTVLITADPMDVGSLLARGAVRERQQRYEDAAADYEKVIELEPEAADGYKARGRMRTATREFADAMKDLNKAVELDADDADAYLARGDARLANGELDKAAIDFDKAAELDPEDADVIHAKVQLAHKRKQFEKAAELAAKAVARDPYNPYRKLALGGELWALKKYAETKAEYIAALELDPSEPDVRNGLAWFYATCPDDKMRDGAKALEFATKAVAVDPHWTLKDTKAAALAEVGRFDEAVAEQSKAIADCKHDPEEVAKMKERLKLYQDKKPYRDEQ